MQHVKESLNQFALSTARYDVRFCVNIRRLFVGGPRYGVRTRPLALGQSFVDGKSMTQSESVAEGFSEVSHGDSGTVVEVCNGPCHFQYTMKCSG